MNTRAPYLRKLKLIPSKLIQSMDVDQFIKEIEENRLEDALRTLSGKDLINTYLGAKEFQRAKIQRATFAPKVNDDSEITIHVVNSKNEINEY